MKNKVKVDYNKVSPNYQKSVQTLMLHLTSQNNRRDDVFGQTLAAPVV